MVEVDTAKKDQSKYNEAALQIMRLNNLWTRIEDCINKGQLTKWKFYLDSVYRELYADIFHLAKPEDTINENKELRGKIAGSSTRNELYDSLNGRHEFLKKLQDNVGKGGVFRDGTEEDID